MDYCNDDNKMREMVLRREYVILPMGAFSDGVGRIINVKSHNGGDSYNGNRFFFQKGSLEDFMIVANV